LGVKIGTWLSTCFGSWPGAGFAADLGLTMTDVCARTLDAFDTDPVLELVPDRLDEVVALADLAETVDRADVVSLGPGNDLPEVAEGAAAARAGVDVDAAAGGRGFNAVKVFDVPAETGLVQQHSRAIGTLERNPCAR